MQLERFARRRIAHGPTPLEPLPRLSKLLGVPDAVARETVAANCDFVGAGYGIPTAGMIEAATLVARSGGILLDPVPAGKGMAGLIDLICHGHLSKGQNVVFLHTGDAVGLYGYRHVLTIRRSPARHGRQSARRTRCSA